MNTVPPFLIHHIKIRSVTENGPILLVWFSGELWETFASVVGFNNRKTRSTGLKPIRGRNRPSTGVALPYSPSPWEKWLSRILDVDVQYKMKDLSNRVLTFYMSLPTSNPAGRHAARQLLLRLKYLNFQDISVHSHAFMWEESLVEKINAVRLESWSYDVKPLSNIFHRPIVRMHISRETDCMSSSVVAPSAWTFSSAILAVQQLPYSGKKFEHLNDIDDINIANEIASCANGEKTTSYGYSWAWKDTLVHGTSHQLGSDAMSLARRILRLHGAKKRSNGILKRLGCGICAIDTSGVA